MLIVEQYQHYISHLLKDCSYDLQYVILDCLQFRFVSTINSLLYELQMHTEQTITNKHLGLTKQTVMS